MRCRVKLSLGTLNGKNSIFLRFSTSLTSFLNQGHSLSKSSLSKCHLLMNLKKIHLEEIIWRQRVQSLWLNHEDHNSKFFYRVKNVRYRYNLIHIIHHNEEIFSAHLNISNAFTTYFSTFFELCIVHFYMLTRIHFIQLVSGPIGTLRVLQ